MRPQNPNVAHNRRVCQRPETHVLALRIHQNLGEMDMDYIADALLWLNRLGRGDSLVQ